MITENIKRTIDAGYDLMVGIVYSGPQEGNYKTEIEGDSKIFYGFGKSIEEALEELEKSIPHN